MPKKGAAPTNGNKSSVVRFRRVLARHTKELKSCCEKWTPAEKDENIPEESRDEIRTVIGLSNLLINQKMKQFGELIDDSEFKRSEKVVTCEDLQGFWDMVYFQVEKLHDRFGQLESLSQRDWVPETEVQKQPEIKQKAPTVPPQKSTSSTEHREAARMRLAEAKQKMKEAMKSKAAKSDEVLEEIKTISAVVESKSTKRPAATTEKKAPKVMKSQNKENVDQHKSTNPKKPRSQKRMAEDFVPLQCVTRSMAARAK